MGLHYALPERCSILCFGVVLFSVPGLSCALCLCYSLCLGVVVHSLLWGRATLFVSQGCSILWVSGLQYIYCPAVVLFSVSLGFGILCVSRLFSGVVVYSLSQGCGIFSVPGLWYIIFPQVEVYSVAWGWTILCHRVVLYFASWGWVLCYILYPDVTLYFVPQGCAMRCVPMMVFTLGHRRNKIMWSQFVCLVGGKTLIQ